MEHKKFTLAFFTVAFVVIMVALFGVISLYATTWLELTLKDLCEQSSDIIIAEVVSAQSYKEENRIYTKVELGVIDKIKGRFRKFDKFNLTQYGGTVNGITTIVVGAPNFIVGEKSVLFLLERNSIRGGKNFIVLGLSQGKFNSSAQC